MSSASPRAIPVPGCDLAVRACVGVYVMQPVADSELCASGCAVEESQPTEY